MYRFKRFAFLLLLLLFFCACTQKTTKIWLDDLKIQTFSEGIASVAPIKPAASDSILIGKVRLERGIRVQTTSVLSFFLDGNAEQFSAVVGVDDNGSKVSQRTKNTLRLFAGFARHFKNY